jgi:hypothetical protein
MKRCNKKNAGRHGEESAHPQDPTGRFRWLAPQIRNYTALLRVQNLGFIDQPDTFFLVSDVAVEIDSRIMQFAALQPAACRGWLISRASGCARSRPHSLEPNARVYLQGCSRRLR